MDPAAPTASTSSLSLPPPPSLPSPTSDSSVLPLSKSAQKKAARKAAYEAAKPERRAREKLQKKEKAKEKRKLVELGVLEKPVSKKQGGQGVKKPWNARIVVDLDFEGKMTEKEIKSMASQLAFCYSSNRLSPNPVPLLITSLVGPIRERLTKSTSGNYKSWRGVEFWEEGYEGIWSEENAKEVEVGLLKGQPQARSRKEDVVYLTGDSPNVLTELEEGKTYILGGIVDRNRYKYLCFDKAVAQGIAHAQLPISEFLPEMTTRKILTVNQVFDIIVQWGEKRDWRAALRAVMPMRKFEDGKKAKKGTTGGAVKENEVYVAQEDEDDEEMEEADGAEEERAERALAKAEAGEEGEAGEVELSTEQSEEKLEPEQTVP